MPPSPSESHILLDNPRHLRRFNRVRRLAQLLDNAFRVPGTKWRFGWDSLLGLVPGAGDIATGVLAVYIVIEAARLGVPKTTLWQMIANVAVDMASGVVPVAGDLVDVAFKSNRRNVELLENHLTPTDKPADI